MKPLHVYTICFTASLLLGGCGKGTAPEAVRVTTPTEQQPLEEPPAPLDLEQSEEWTFLAALRPVNPKFSGRVTGSVTLDRDGDRFLADVRVALAPGEIIHMQSVHQGGRCPEESDDLNKDGIIDALEGISVYGNKLLPLDGNLNAQLAGLSTGPRADQWGNYIYVRMASFKRMLQDLKKLDDREEDEISKLEAHEHFDLEGRVAVIYGVSPGVDLPATVTSTGTWGAHSELPIACGIISQVKSPPGIPYSDDHLGSVEVPEGAVPEIILPGGG